MVSNSQQPSRKKVKSFLPLLHGYDKPPIGLKWRSNTLFIVSTVGIGMFVDIFLYGLIVPVLPFMLQDRVHIPQTQIQSITSDLLAIYAGASMLASPVAGILADRFSSSHQLPFLLGLVLLLLSTILLAIGQSVAVLSIARVLQGGSGGVVWTIGLALLVETVGSENLGKAIGSIFSVTSVAGLFAPVIGGSLYAKTGYAGVFGLGAALIAIDFIMRLLVVEKKVATRYSSPSSSPSHSQESSAQDESTPLLSQQSPDLAEYRLPKPNSRLTRNFPLLLILWDPSLLTAFFMGFIQAFLLGSFDATVPIVASIWYNFDSLKAGLLFFPLGGADLFLGPIFGWAVDRFGTRIISIVGFTYLVPALVLLRLPAEGVTDAWDLGHQVALYASLLALCGIGMAIINSPSIVEAGNVVEKYYKANPEIFDDEVPYAQLYGINSMIWCGGLTVGPLAAGALREKIGYGNMNAVLGGICGLTAILAVLFVGGGWTTWIRERMNRDREEED